MEHESFKKINFPNLKQLTICVAMLCQCILYFHRVSGVEYTERIMGGNEADREQWPFIAALYHTKKLEYFCGGTLIANRHILTGDEHLLLYC